MASAASLPARRSACGVLALAVAHGARGSGASAQKGRGATGSSCGSRGVFPTSGRKESLAHRVGERLAGACPAWPGRVVPHPCPAWAAGLPRSEWPGQEPFRPPSPLLHLQPVSSLGVPAQHWPPRALCCTYRKLVFIPCENDILFLLSVSVFMCEELLACCARARGELVPGDWQPNAPFPALALGRQPGGPGS